MTARSTLATALGALTLLALACSDPVPTDPPTPSIDADGDTIADAAEGDASVDTDGDGTPDYLDTDSDGDGIPDYREAGDADVATPPVDSDGDGVPDFQDPDSDNNGLPDGVDGTGDADGDGVPDFQDLDDDNDGLTDAQEMGPAGPIDSDGDGLPDYQDPDSDDDGMPDAVEGTGDADGDGVPDWIDPRNDAPPPTLTFTPISTTFSSPIGIDFHEPTGSVIMSANYPTGLPSNLERIELDGTHVPFSAYAGMTDEVKIATVRSGNLGGFPTGDLFMGNGVDGEIVRISADGATITNPWVSLPGDNNGLLRGSMYLDRTGVYGGDLIAVTTNGEVWRITAAGVPTRLASVGTHLEGLITVPPFPARFGPLAGKIIAGAEQQGLLYAFDAAGAVTTYALGVAVEDIDMITPDENYFGVSYGTSRLLGVPRTAWTSVVGDIMLATETVPAGTTGLFRVYWDGSTLTAQPFPLDPASTGVTQWEHVTFAGAGIQEIP
ncbi:MAG: hypothetical protein R3B06_15535 [Kofleriaceae bacterium]